APPISPAASTSISAWRRANTGAGRPTDRRFAQLRRPDGASRRPRSVPAGTDDERTGEARDRQRSTRAQPAAGVAAGRLLARDRFQRRARSEPLLYRGRGVPRAVRVVRRPRQDPAVLRLAARAGAAAVGPFVHQLPRLVHG